MDKEQAIRLVQNNGKAVQIEAAKRRLINFAKYVNPKLDISPFHFVYYQILDKFAHGQIKKLIVSVPPQSGKALKVDTPVLTTKGWKRHADLAVGDYVFGEDGKPKQVLWNSGAYKHKTQIVRFADGFELTAAPEHEWVIYADHDNHKGREREIIETQNIFRKRNRRNPAIMANAELVTENCELPINPYLLGVWLGDGKSKDKWVCCGEQKFEHYKPYIIEHKPTNTARMVHLRGLETRDLRLLGVLENKHIPIQYILADKESRLKLLQGLMDTDGYTDTKGRCEFCQMDGQLAEDVYVLLRTLGYKPTAHKYTAKLYGKDCGIKVRIQFTPNKGDAVFSIPYKRDRVNNKTRNDRADKNKFFITEIVNGDEQLVNCIQVEGGIYLAGRQLVPTHNSEGSSRILPSYMLGLNPDLKICIGSYSATIARDFNRDVQRIIDKEEYHDIFPATQLNNKNIVTVSSNYLRNSDVFECVGRKGGLRVVGRGGSLTSKTVDISILDDVYKDYAEGNSPVIREAAWKWYTTVVRTRLHNDSQEIIVFTRWHEDDLIGRLEKSGEQIIDVKSWADIENVPKAAWVKINFEAIKTTEPNEIDKRQIGEALWPARHSLEKLIAQKELDAVQFQCLFQGNPSSAEGRLYNAFKTWTDKNEFGEYIRTGCYIDVADTGKDYLCAICYEVRKSANTIYNEKTHRFEPILFALVTDIIFTQESTEITTISVPEMINRNGVQRCYVEANNGGTQFERTISRKVRAQTIAITQHANKESRILTNSAAVNQQIVFPLGWADRWPKFFEHITTYLRDFKANEHDDGCFIAGTMIATKWGQKPIEMIKKGDKVITPIGYCRVIECGCTGMRKVITKYGLTGTKKHPVFQQKRFDVLSEIDENLLSLLDFKNILKWKYKKALCSTVLHTDLWGREGIIYLNQVPMMAEKVQKDYMWQFGSFIAKKQYQKAIVFTIKMAILLITTILIWSAYQFGNIYQNTQRKILRMKNLEKRIWRISMKTEKKQQNGTKAKSGENGTKNTHYKEIIHLLMRIFANIAAKHSFLIKKPPISAAHTAEKNINGTSKTILRFAKNVEKDSTMEKIGQVSKIGNSAHYPAVQNINTNIEKVYNLTVETAHCYYANEILVSNCDALTAIVERELADGNTRPYGAETRGVRVR